MKNVYAVRKLHQFQKKMEDKHLKCIIEHDGFRGNCLIIDVLEVSMYEFIDRDGPLDDYEPIQK